MQKRAEQVLANSDIKDDEKTKIQALVNNIEDCTNNAGKFKRDDLNKLYIVLRQTEARILEDKLKKEYACLGESGLEINLVEKTNEDLKSEGFKIDDEAEVETTTEENKEKSKKNNKIATASTAKSSKTTTAQAKKKTKSPTKTDKNTKQEHGYYLSYGNTTILCRR